MLCGILNMTLALTQQATFMPRGQRGVDGIVSLYSATAVLSRTILQPLHT